MLEPTTLAYLAESSEMAPNLDFEAAAPRLCPVTHAAA